MSALAESRWRLIDSGPCAAAWNMALDEALLEGFEEGDPPILRLYRWAPAALSLGRFQRADDVEPPSGATVVRRLTGGAAIHHRTDEVTYAVVAPYALFGGRSPRLAYHGIHDLLRAALRELGVEPDPPRPPEPGPSTLRGLCFSTATDYDLTVGGLKLIGSAQRRRGRAFLQHGSLPLSPGQASGATCLSALLDPAPSPEVVSQKIASAFRAVVSVLTPSTPSTAEKQGAERLARNRYTSPAWTSAH